MKESITLSSHFLKSLSRLVRFYFSQDLVIAVSEESAFDDYRFKVLSFGLNRTKEYKLVLLSGVIIRLVLVGEGK